MKKFLLILSSWAMMLAGTVAFTSCGDDDDDKGGNGGGGDAYTQYFEDDNFYGAKIVGDDIIYKSSYGGYDQLVVYHFQGDTYVSASSYMDMGTPAAAKKAAESASQRENIKSATTNGKWLITTISDECQGFEGFSKQKWCDVLNSKDY